MRNIRLTIEFDGSGYSGWQFQPNRPTVQGELQKAVREATGERATVYGCGRTDGGVSALAYVANFHTSCHLGCERLVPALNHHLPRDILILSAREAPVDFHARYSARSKTYRYRIVTRRSPLRRRTSWELRARVEADRMRKGSPLLLGEHDFRFLCHVQDPTGLCNITDIRISDTGDEIDVLVRGNRFLYKMVRRIVGALVAYGSRRLSQRDIRAALAGKPHRHFTTAPACGLLLDSVAYSN